MIEFIVLVLGIALFLYAFMAGADFGAGALEILGTKVPRDEKTHFIGTAMGPVWEANHIWLILALVITFVALPDIFWFVSEWYHFPIGGLLIGIIFRGVSFTFLHYDPIIDKSQKVYHWIFGLSSIWCAMWLGIITGSLMLGDFSLSELGVYERYFKHWLNPFAFSMGLFATALMMFNAALFLSAEATKHKEQWKALTLKTFIFLVVSGILAHGAFILTNLERWKIFFLNPISIGLIVLSFILLYPQVHTIEHNYRNLSRVIAGAQVFCIICAGFIPLIPNIILFKDLTGMDIYESAAEPRTLVLLIYALAVGLVIILPTYIYLMRIFKTKSVST